MHNLTTTFTYITSWSCKKTLLWQRNRNHCAWRFFQKKKKNISFDVKLCWKGIFTIDLSMMNNCLKWMILKHYPTFRALLEHVFINSFCWSSLNNMHPDDGMVLLEIGTFDFLVYWERNPQLCARCNILTQKSAQRKLSTAARIFA